MKRRENWILHRRRHYLLWNGKGVTTDQFNWKVVFWLSWILHQYLPPAAEKSVHSYQITELTYYFMLTKKRSRNSATTYAINLSKLSISVDLNQKFVFKCLLKGTQGSFRTVKKLQSCQYFVVFYILQIFSNQLRKVKNVPLDNAIYCQPHLDFYLYLIT